MTPRGAVLQSTRGVLAAWRGPACRRTAWARPGVRSRRVLWRHRRGPVPAPPPAWRGPAEYPRRPRRVSPPGLGPPRREVTPGTMEAAIKIAVDIAGADAGDSGGTLRHSSGCRQPPSDLQFSNTPCVEWQQDDWMAGTDSFCNSFPAVVHSVFSVVATSQDSTLHDKSKRISTPLVDKYSINVNIIF